MLNALLTPKYWILFAYIASTLYTHFRGKVRHKWHRQLADHSTFMAPINVFMYAFSKVPTTPYVDTALFPELKLLQDNWQLLREEALRLDDAGHIKASLQYDDVGFNSFFRKGWKRFYLKWYHPECVPSAQILCPKTCELLRKIPGLKAAMFASLPPGGKLVKHRDPYAGSLRYHLGLVTPNADNCRIYVDNEMYYWRDGEAVMFDETYIHHAINESDVNRIILFCDIERPMRYRFAQWLNHFFGRYVLTQAAAQNLPTDKIGSLNRAFKYLYQVRLVGKKLKAWNKSAYYVVKWSLFGGILYLIFI